MTAAQKAQPSTPDVASAHEKILIVDFGSQVTQLIARRVREQGVYCEIVPFQKAEAAFREMRPKGVILSGGPESVHEAGSPRAPQAIFDSGVPVLGICYGQMTMAAQLGGEVEGGHHREFGRADVEVKAESALFDSDWAPGERHQVWMSHGDRITRMPPGFAVAGVSANAPFAIIQDEKRKYYGLMFHPEVVHTPDGAKLLRNFVRKIAGLAGDWTMRAFREEAIEKIRAQVGKGRVICGLSGGVDSAVAAVLIHEAIGDQLTCVFVDHGLLRLERGRDRRRPVPASLQHPAGACGCLEAIPRRTRRRHRSRGEAQDHRAPLHRRVRGGGQEDRRRRVSGAGHALSRRDRERVVHRRTVGDHQEPPQCRRPAGAHEHEAGRAAS